ncbi:MAG: hypothetical protein RDU20_19545 [Desulfomonilaceae bacterium]|nr:hypothetical protein [Desulfomonilaceae bacterium]
MESLISNIIIQGAQVPGNTWTGICAYWKWILWVGFAVGIIGTIASFLMKPLEDG